MNVDWYIYSILLLALALTGLEILIGKRKIDTAAAIFSRNVVNSASIIIGVKLMFLPIYTEMGDFDVKLGMVLSGGFMIFSPVDTYVENLKKLREKNKPRKT